ncbi:recombinase family protein [Frankia sp. Cr2]|uniref:recombinase family protein n=1 Tax=Frankia sp. Cr2 TaxID=3073932 RepID=UPI002AD1D640|nr:recombinase family protein [Frankia sp. Cr2]
MPQTAYGYISLEDDDETEVERLHDLITAFARAEGMAIGEIYVDRNMPSGRIVRSALTMLLDAVLRVEHSLIVVPTPEHLSNLQPIRRAIEVEIEGLGARVVTITGGGTPQLPHQRQPAIPLPRSA